MTQSVLETFAGSRTNENLEAMARDERTYRSGSTVSNSNDFESLFTVLGLYNLVFGEVESEKVQDGSEQVDIPPFGDEINRVSRSHNGACVNVIHHLLPRAWLVMDLGT